MLLGFRPWSSHLGIPFACDISGEFFSDFFVYVLDQHIRNILIVVTLIELGCSHWRRGIAVRIDSFFQVGDGIECRVIFTEVFLVILVLICASGNEDLLVHGLISLEISVVVFLLGKITHLRRIW